MVKALNTIFAAAMAVERLVPQLAAFIAGEDAAANRVAAALAADAGYAPLIVADRKAAGYLEAMAHLNVALAFGSDLGAEGGFAYVKR